MTSAYLAPSVGFRGTRDFDDENANYGTAAQSIYRVTDIDGDGRFGFDSDQSVAIVDNIRASTLHQVNQLQVRGDTLFANIGSTTESGGINAAPSGDQRFPGESQYTGTLCFIKNLNAVGDSTNAAGFDFVDSGPANFASRDLNNDGSLNQFVIDDAAARTDIQAFTSEAEDKLRVYATGFRNNFGLGINDAGEIFIGENEENGTGRQDQLNQATFQSDHGFPAENDLLDFSLNQDALDAGFFGPDQGGINVGLNSSAVGLAFLGEDAGAFEGDVLLSRFARGDVILVDPLSGTSSTILSNVLQTLDIVEDPFGNYLVTDGDGTIQILAVNGVSSVPEPGSGLLLATLGGLLLARRKRSEV